MAQTQPAQITFRIWRITRHYPEIVELGSDDASLVRRVAILIAGQIEPLNDSRRQPVAPMQRPDFRENCRTGIALFGR